MENINDFILVTDPVQTLEHAEEIATHPFDMGNEVFPFTNHNDQGDAGFPMPDHNTPVAIVQHALVTLDDITFNTEETEDPGQIGVLNTDWPPENDGLAPQAIQTQELDDRPAIEMDWVDDGVQMPRTQSGRWSCDLYSTKYDFTEHFMMTNIDRQLSVPPLPWNLNNQLELGPIRSDMGMQEIEKRWVSKPLPAPNINYVDLIRYGNTIPPSTADSIQQMTDQHHVPNVLFDNENRPVQPYDHPMVDDPLDHAIALHEH